MNNIGIIDENMEIFIKIILEIRKNIWIKKLTKFFGNQEL